MAAGTMMKHARWGGAGCLRACGMNLVECGTLLWYAVGPSLGQPYVLKVVCWQNMHGGAVSTAFGRVT